MLWKTIQEKEKMLGTMLVPSIFFFSHSAYLTKRNCHLSTICHLQMLSIWSCPITTFNDPVYEALLNIVGKENGNQHFFLSPLCFLPFCNQISMSWIYCCLQIISISSRPKLYFLTKETITL